MAEQARCVGYFAQSQYLPSHPQPTFTPTSKRQLPQTKSITRASSPAAGIIALYQPYGQEMPCTPQRGRNSIGGGMQLQQPLPEFVQQAHSTAYNPYTAYSAMGWVSAADFDGRRFANFDQSPDLSAESPPSLYSGASDIQPFMDCKIDTSPVATPGSPWIGSETGPFDEGQHQYNSGELQGLGIDMTGESRWTMQSTYLEPAQRPNGLPQLHHSHYFAPQCGQSSTTWQMPAVPLASQGFAYLNSLPQDVGVTPPFINPSSNGNATPEAPRAALQMETSETTMSSAQKRKREDQVLLQGKESGMTYKDIRRAIGGTVAESTLRGRYRVLTKERKDRVRKPVWKDRDIALLKQIVGEELAQLNNSCYRHTSVDQRLSKISWKRVGEHIKAHGGSYHFGNSTCKKKFAELQRARQV